MSEFREFNHSYIDPCPKCNALCEYSAQFKKFGEHRVFVCRACRVVIHNGDEAPLERGPVPAGLV